MILLSSNSLNLGYIGSSVLIFFYKIESVVVLTTLYSFGTIFYLYTIGILLSTTNYISNIKLFFRLPIIYILGLYIIYPNFLVDYDLSFLNNYLSIISFLYLKLGLILFGSNLESYFQIFFKQTKTTKSNNNSWIKYILFDKYIILPFIILLCFFIAYTFFITQILSYEYISILALLTYCPVAFNLVIFIRYLKGIFIQDLIKIIFISLIISLVILMIFLNIISLQ